MKHKFLTIGLSSLLLTGVLGLNLAEAASPLAGWLPPAASARAGVVFVGERLDRPARAPGDTPVKRTPDTATNAIVNNLAAAYEKAAGSTSHVLTKQAAIDSGWGWGADHFDAIDSQNKGAVTLADVLDYVSRTSRMALLRTAAATEAIQVLH